jgi:intein-encoded DNA endonuclease-like protein
MPTTSTPKQLLIEHRYDGDLTSDIKKMAASGTSWREMAERVSARCGYTVSHESLRQWYGQHAA